jgi:hypothetical protein
MAATPYASKMKSVLFETIFLYLEFETHLSKQISHFIEQSSVAVEGALAKVSRVLPLRARERLQAMSEHLVLFAPQQTARPNVSLFITLSERLDSSGGLPSTIVPIWMNSPTARLSRMEW